MECPSRGRNEIPTCREPARSLGSRSHLDPVTGFVGWALPTRIDRSRRIACGRRVGIAHRDRRPWQRPAAGIAIVPPPGTGPPTGPKTPHRPGNPLIAAPGLADYTTRYHYRVGGKFVCRQESSPCNKRVPTWDPPSLPERPVSTKAAKTTRPATSGPLPWALQPADRQTSCGQGIRQEVSGI
jgi:hypothetical protein